MEDIAFLRQTDPSLKKIIDTLPQPNPESSYNVFHDLMSCIIEQQIHYRSTKKLFNKMLIKADLEVLSPENFEEFEEKAFSDVKLSARKYETIVSTLDYFSQNQLDWPALSDDVIRQELSKIKGIGTWTMDMILLYTLKRPNIFPADDYHLKILMTSLYQLDAQSRLKAQMKAVAEKWAPFKSLAVRYLLDWKKMKKEK